MRLIEGKEDKVNKELRHDKTKVLKTMYYQGKHVSVCYDCKQYSDVVKDMSCDDVFMLNVSKEFGKKQTTSLYLKNKQ